VGELEKGLENLLRKRKIKYKAHEDRGPEIKSEIPNLNLI